ncbi:MAG: tyrosine-type recombinase/integrase [Sphingobacteriales bacterium JAD_PAG50586_3]|nr:MAG: tyrosine-type recombinase/integrase [Sphingobacteriales bacterium JAD_PAG50586_3]
MFRQLCWDDYRPHQSFFTYIEREHNIPVSPYYKNFKIERPQPAILVLSPERFNYLIYNSEFEESLTPGEQRIKDIFILGCVTALRFSDLIKLSKSNILTINGECYVSNVSQKTSTTTKVKLPTFAHAIVKKHIGRRQQLFTTISLFNFNKTLKNIGEKAGWTEPIFKTRKRKGQEVVLYKNNAKREHYRFCDLMSSHIMRRTAITTMLTLGVDETVARKISGHAPGSAEFHRYVKFSQDFLNHQTNDYFSKLAQIHVPQKENTLSLQH